MAKFDYKNITDADGFKAAAKLIGTRNMSVKKDMQNALVCALKHMDAHGDWTCSILPLIEVASTFGKNLEVALQEWVLKFSWMGFTDKKWAKDKAKVMDIAGAEAQDWWTMERAAKGKPFDFQKAIQDLFDKIDAESKKDDTTNDVGGLLNMLNREAEKRLAVDPIDKIDALFTGLPSSDKLGMLNRLAATLVPVEEVQSQPQDEEAVSEAVAA